MRRRRTTYSTPSAVTAVPELLTGGMGRAWRAGDVVLKPVEDEAEHDWVCGVYDAWIAAEVRVPRPLRAEGGWSFGGWGAHLHVPGTTARLGDDPDWFGDACVRFHEATAELASAVVPRRSPGPVVLRRGSGVGRRSLRWAPPRPRTGSGRAVARLRDVDLPCQVVHGDLGGNLLRDGDMPGVIDWPAYWRPAAWALAVVATDAVCWEDADPSVMERLVTGSGLATAAAPRGDLPARDQGIPRAPRDRDPRSRRLPRAGALDLDRGEAVSDHYFSADPSVPFAREPFTCEVWGQRLDLVSGSGVYSRGRLDSGTSVLFRETYPPAPGRVLDLGTGYGVIGLAVAAAWRAVDVPPDAATVTGVEVNRRAVLLATENAHRLGLADRFLAVAPEEVPAHAVYDEIWSNPPIRIGKQALHELLMHWLATAPARGSCGDGRRQEPRRRLPAGLAHRPGLPDHPAGQCEGLPGPGVAARLGLSGR